MSEETVKRIEIDNLSILKTLFGNLDANVRKTEDAFGVRINSREGPSPSLGLWSRQKRWKSSSAI